ncbi:prepilin-type N-terminal cleavage/methylation domain-containing protein [Luteimonas sp. TWI1416]|uniref:prepilin-type N-terminal cleavage/methylation domain-containing protein n=1 Tax=unclassified Luteimonas TaxID=2629088 RepID=UPI0032099CEB
MTGAGFQARNRAAGMALVELMIAMVLGLLVVGAAFAIFLSNQRSYTANEDLNRIQENARIALDLIARDIRAAGGAACSSASEVASSNSNALLFRDTPITGSASTLRVASGEDAAYKIASASATSLTLAPGQLTKASTVFSTGDVLLLCNARKTFLVTATGVGDQDISFAALPSGYDPAADPYASLATVALARFRDVTWSVANNANNKPSLFVKRGSGASEEVIEGVQSVAFSYLDSSTGIYSTTPNFANVIAVRVELVLQGAAVDGSPLLRRASSVISVRGRTL